MIQTTAVPREIVSVDGLKPESAMVTVTGGGVGVVDSTKVDEIAAGVGAPDGGWVAVDETMMALVGVGGTAEPTLAQPARLNRLMARPKDSAAQ